MATKAARKRPRSAHPTIRDGNDVRIELQAIADVAENDRYLRLSVQTQPGALRDAQATVKATIYQNDPKGRKLVPRAIELQKGTLGDLLLFARALQIAVAHGIDGGVFSVQYDGPTIY